MVREDRPDLVRVILYVYGRFGGRGRRWDVRLPILYFSVPLSCLGRIATVSYLLPPLFTIYQQDSATQAYAYIFRASLNCGDCGGADTCSREKASTRNFRGSLPCSLEKDSRTKGTRHYALPLVRDAVGACAGSHSFGNWASEMLRRSLRDLSNFARACRRSRGTSANVSLAFCVGAFV